MTWARSNLRRELALGRCYREMFSAARDGMEKCDLNDEDFRCWVDLRRRREELEKPPDAMFRHIQAPALAIAGEEDLNVPSYHARRAATIMQRAGNRRASARIIPGADHSFQASAKDENMRMVERHDFTSFERPYVTEVYEEILIWLGDFFGASG